uniref:Uncharacterized protein MANES_06G144200 n=1 Tax=Rhizophora mucronata TaxID=61149 RepID=A0A2P2J9K2_RHIMU
MSSTSITRVTLDISGNIFKQSCLKSAFAITNCRQELETEQTRARSEGSSNCRKTSIDMSAPSHSTKS